MRKVCDAMKLPDPYPERLAVEPPVGRAAGFAKQLDVPREQRMRPRRMRRDEWFGPGELEFVLDNQTVAKLINVELRISNPFYAPAIHRLREKMERLYTVSFEFKAKMCNHCDWRA